MANIPELDLDLNGPLVKVLVLVHAHLAGAADLLKVVAEGVVDLAHELVQPRLPLALDGVDLFVELRHPRLLVRLVGPLPLDPGRISLVLFQRSRVASLDDLEFGLLHLDGLLDVLDRLVFGLGRQLIFVLLGQDRDGSRSGLGGNVALLLQLLADPLKGLFAFL
jgi:hypothetical protein